MRTDFGAGSGASFTSLAWGDGYTATINLSGGSQDNEHFAGLEQDAESGTEHAQFRNYTSAQGRWLAPDPYLSSYDSTNPQSMNRYAYALNNPTSLVNPSGLDTTQPVPCTDANGNPIFCMAAVNGPLGDGGDIECWWCMEYGGGGAIECWWCSVPPGSSSGGASGSTASTLGPSRLALLSAPNNGIGAKVCSAIPSGRTEGVSGGLGGVGSVGGGGELVFNYNSGQVSAFGFGGVQVGWNGGASGSIYTGFVYGLNSSNSNYSGGFTGFNVGDGLGIFGASSSGGLSGGTGGLAPNGAVTAGGISLGGGLLGGLAGGATATNYTNPLQLGKLWAFDPLDALL